MRNSYQSNRWNEGPDSVQRSRSVVPLERFGKELSRKRWSSFSYSRYFEEVVKYSKPGLVVEKTAYFEAPPKKKGTLLPGSFEGQSAMSCCAQYGKSTAVFEHSAEYELTESARDVSGVFSAESQVEASADDDHREFEYWEARQSEVHEPSLNTNEQMTEPEEDLCAEAANENVFSGTINPLLKHVSSKIIDTTRSTMMKFRWKLGVYESPPHVRIGRDASEVIERSLSWRDRGSLPGLKSGKQLPKASLPTTSQLHTTPKAAGSHNSRSPLVKSKRVKNNVTSTKPSLLASEVVKDQQDGKSFLTSYKRECT